MLSNSAKFEISDLPQENFAAPENLPPEARASLCLMGNTPLIPSLLNDEVLSFPGIYQLLDVYELLSKSERRFLNLKFEVMKFHDGSSFWINNGPRIRSIDFRDCPFFIGLLEEILIHCENLFHLSFTYTAYFKYMVENMDAFPLMNALERVSGKGIVRENLNSLKIDITYPNWIPLSDYVLHQLFLIFPKIKILKITSDFDPGEFHDFPRGDVHVDRLKLLNKNHVTMSPVANYLNASSKQIEKLNLKFTSATFSSASLRYLLETVSSLNRLTEFRLETKNTAKIEDIAILLGLKQIKSLELRIDLKYEDLNLFLSRLLSNSDSSLQHLRIRQLNEPLIITKLLCEKLILSGLKTLAIEAHRFYLDDYSPLDSCIFTQNKVIDSPNLSFTIKAPYLCNDIFRFLQYFQNLRHFVVSHISDVNLQFLLKYQKKLRSLQIYSANDCFDYRNNPDDLGFNELKDLEYLELTNPSVGNFFFRTLAPAPILAKLRFLRITVGSTDTKGWSGNDNQRVMGITSLWCPLVVEKKTQFSSDLLRSADSMPFLDAVNIAYECNISFDVVVELCTKLSRLRFFSYKGNWHLNGGEITDEHYRKLFSICPSLRALEHFDWHVITYYYDVINKTVVLKKNDNVGILGSPRIGELIVPWLII